MIYFELIINLFLIFMISIIRPRVGFIILIIIISYYSVIGYLFWSVADAEQMEIKIFKLLKDIILYGIFIGSLAKLYVKGAFKSLQRPFFGISVIFILIVVLYTLAGTENYYRGGFSGSSPDKYTALRFYLMPLLVVLFAFVFGNDLQFFNRVCTLLMFFGIFAGVLSILEIFIFSPDILVMNNFISYCQQFNNLLDSQIGEYGLPFTYTAFNGIRRASAFFNSGPLELSTAMLSIIPISLGSLLFRTSSKFLAMTSLIFASAALFLTISRVAIILIFIQFFLAIYFNRKKSSKHYTLIILCFFICSLIILLSNEVTKKYIVDTITFQESSSAGHLLSVVFILQEIINHPLGIGTGNSISESFYLNIALELGLIGVVVVLTMIVMVLKNAISLINSSANAYIKRLSFITFVSWLTISIEISKSVVGWSYTLGIYMMFFYAGTMLSHYYSLRGNVKKIV